MRALAWALIHSLWQCLGMAALAAVLMAFSRRPPLRYMIGVGALAVMLAVPAATFFVLLKPAAPVALPASIYAAPANSVAPIAVPSPAISGRVIESFTELPRPSPNLLPWLVAAWLCGVAGFSLRFAGGFLLLEHKRRKASFAPAARILLLCQQLQEQLGLSRTIRYLECTWLQAPAVIGWLRPIVLLPACALTGLSEAQLKAVIAHELAHIRRFDALVNLFQILVEILLFYHPAIWWLNRRIRAERELCCDEIALQVAGDRLDYAQALTLMAEWEQAPALAMAANRGPLTLRILHILGRKSSSAGQRIIGLTGSILFLIAALAAANALFGAGSPIPMAQAKENVTKSVNAVLSSGKSAVDHAVQALQAATKNAEPDKPKASPETAAQTESTKDDRPEKLVPPPADLSDLLPKENLSTPTVVASLDARIANGQPAAPPVQASLNVPAKESPILYHCHNSSVFGQVISPKMLLVQGFACFNGGGAEIARDALYGSCPRASTYPERINHQCKFDVTLNVQLADPADAAKMQVGKIVRLAGAFRVGRENRIDYISVANAKVIWTDPFDRRAIPAQPTAKAIAAVAAKDLPAAAPVSNDRPAAPPATVLASLNVATPGAHTCRTSKVFARVISPDQIQLPGFVCLPGDKESFTPLQFGSCPFASADMLDREKGCKFDVTMKMQLADYGDAFKMKRRGIVRLSGDVRLIRDRQGNIQGDSLTMENARLLQADPFALLPPAFRCLPSELDALAERIGRRLCVQNDIMANLKLTGAALQAAILSPLHDPEVNGSAGDPEAITCRLPEDKKPSAHLRPLPLNCAYNSVWARVHYIPPMGSLAFPANGGIPGPFYSGDVSGGYGMGGNTGSATTAHGNGPNGQMP